VTGALLPAATVYEIIAALPPFAAKLVKLDSGRFLVIFFISKLPDTGKNFRV
jgi:hypothetical protein